jgi:hypothetical protein
MTAEECLRWLEYADIAATLLLVGRLLSQKLQLAYRSFFIYLVFDLIESFAGLVPLHDRAGVYRYVVGQTIMTILGAFVIVEIYHLALAERKALARFGRNLVAGAFVGSVLLTVIVQISSVKSQKIEFPLLRYTFVFEGVLDSTQLLFLCAMGVFLAWFPVEIRRNLVVYIAGFLVYFLARWSALMLFLRRTTHSEWLNVALYTIILVCIGFWIRAMQRAGEEEKTTTGYRWNPEEMARLKAQLDEINDSLERLAK